MPIQAQSADGMIHEFPDGTAPGIVDNAMKQYATQAKPEPAPDATNFMQRAGAGVTRPIEGLARIGEHVGIPGAKTVADALSEKRAAYNALRGDEAGKFSGAEMAGEVGATLPLALAMPVGSTIPRMMLSGAAQGGAQGALEAAVTAKPQSFLQDVGTGAAIGAGTGGLTGGALGAVSKAISPTVSPEVRMLLDEGVTPTPGQLGGRTVRTIEKMTEHVPLVGNLPIAAENRTLDQFNLATVNRALRPIGEELPKGTEAGNDAIAQAKSIISRKYGDVLSRLSATSDNQFAGEIGSAIGQLPTQEAGYFASTLKRLVGDGSKPIDGATFKAARSELHDLSERYGRDQSVNNKMLGDAFEQAAESLTNLAQRANPAAASELAAVDSAYARFARARDAASKDLTHGVFSPSQYAGSLKSASGKAAYGTGAALDQPWAQAALKVMGPNAPHTQGAVSNMMGGAGLAYALPHLLEPATLATSALAAGMYTPTGQRITAAMIAKRPEWAQAVANALRQSAPVFNTGAASQATR